MASYSLRVLFLALLCGAAVVFLCLMLQSNRAYNQLRHLGTGPRMRGENVWSPQQPLPGAANTTVHVQSPQQPLPGAANTTVHVPSAGVVELDRRNGGKPKHFTGRKKTTLFSNSSKSLFVSDPSKPVICHTFSPGRLGNHLFEYASILGLAHKLNKTFFFENDEDIQKVLKYPPVQNHRTELKARCHKAKRLEERYLCRYDGNLLTQDPAGDYSIGTYLQSWVYFDEIRQEMKKAVTFADGIVQNATKVLDGLRKKYPNTIFVGVHNRRGDMTNKGFASQGYVTATPDFFKRALTYFRSIFSRVKFIVLGEDEQWNKDNIHPVNDDVIVLKPSSSSAVDIQILSLTDHMIRTVGTFGWWAAFKIPGKPTVVYLKDFVRKKSSLSKWYSENAEDYMLPGWIGL